MNQNGMPGGLQRQGAPAQNRSFRPEMARETENVLRRSGGESLDEYLTNINQYLRDLNGRLGAPEQLGTPAPQGDVPFAAPQEQPAPVPGDGGWDATGYGPADGDPNAGYDNAAPEYGPGYGPAAGYGENAVPPYDPYYDPAAPGYDPYYDPAAAYGGAYAPAYGEGYPGEDASSPDTNAPPYGVPFSAERYAAAVEPAGYAGGDWQAAVPNPELYPDLDDPAVTGKKSRKKEKKRREKKARAPKTTKGGKSRSSFVTTVLNLALYGGWSVLYFICLSVRSMMFTGAQTQMASQGVQNYSVTVSSPLFTVLKILIYAMPAVVLLWMRGVLKAEKKQLPQLDKKLLIAAFAVDILAGVIVIFDVLAAKLVFG